jgi:hypothetical protein
LTCEYIREFSKKSKKNGPNGILWGLGGNRFMKKTRSEKSRDTVPLNRYKTCETKEHAGFVTGTRYL